MSTEIVAKYDWLKKQFEKFYHFEDALALLEWDFETTMPKAASESRGAVMSSLMQSKTDLLSGAEIEQNLQEVLAQKSVLPSKDQKNLLLMERIYHKMSALPETLDAEIMSATTSTIGAWHKAREANDFQAITPALTEMVTLQQQKAQALAKGTQKTPYEALMGNYVVGMSEDRISQIFGNLSKVLPAKIQKAEKQSKGVKPLPAVPVEAQKVISKKIMEMLGFDFERGRLDEAVHPFCGGATDDVRLTTNYNLGTYLDGFLAVGHETGHGLYEQGLPADYKFQPLGRTPCMAVHESQSLFVENKILKSPEFAEWLEGELAQECPNANVTKDQIQEHLTQVSCSFIRIEADEVTYPAHVMLRFEIERDVINGDLEIKDIPDVWAQKMKQTLGIEPATDRDGALQDIHWYGGAWGYFPSYTLGALAAAQFAEAAEKEMPDMMAKVAQGDFKDVRQWLKKNIHEKGADFDSLDGLLKEVTGKPLEITSYLNHIDTRYCHSGSVKKKTSLKMSKQRPDLKM